MLAIGANLGGANRPPLLYAVSDAERFARVMIDIGGVAAPNEILLKHTGQTMDRIERDTDRDTFMSAREAMEYGVVDQVLERVPHLGTTRPPDKP